MQGCRVRGRHGCIFDHLVRTSLDALEQGITVFDEELKLVFANVKFLELRDLPPELGAPGTSFEAQVRYRAERGDYGPGDVETLVRNHVALAGKFQAHRIERRRPDGRLLEIRGDPLPGGGFIATYTDITERNQAEEALRSAYSELELARSSYENQGEQLAVMVESLSEVKRDLERANRTKVEFLANMSHELRTPLNAIIGFSQIMETELLGPIGQEPYRKYAGDINTSGRHLLELINDILDMSKIESGMDEINEQNTSIYSVINSVVTMIRGRPETAALNLVLDLEEGLPLVRADTRKLKQVLLNLLSNAVKFTPAGGTVRLKGWSSGDSGLVLQVADSGIGMALEDIPKALAPFQQVHGLLNREYEGTGLGLPLTKALVEQHGGSLDLQSHVGRGTTVTVRLPAERIIWTTPDEMALCAGAHPAP